MFEDTRAGSIHIVKYSSGEADDTVCERAWCVHVAPYLRQKQSPHNLSSKGPWDLNQHMALETMGRYNFTDKENVRQYLAYPVCKIQRTITIFVHSFVIQNFPAADLLN